MTKLISYFLPNGLERRDIKAIPLRMFITIALFIIILGVVGFLISEVFPTSKEIYVLYIISSLASIALGFLILLLIKFTGSIVYTFNVAALIALVILTIPVFQSGGIYSSTVWWILIFPVASYFIVSQRAGIIWSTVAVVYIIIVYVIHTHFVDKIQNYEAPVRRMTDMAFITLFVSFVMYIYERNRKTMIDQMEKAQKKLKRKNKSLLELNRENETLMAIVAHDLRAPNNQILGLVRFIEKDQNLQGDSAEMIGMCKKIATDSLSMISDITYIKELKDGRVKAKTEQVDPIVFIKELCSTFQANADEKRIVLETIIHSENTREVSIDLGLTKRICQNVLSNALKFSPFDSKITVSSVMEKNKWIISVKDQGPGISKEEQAQMFERFRRLSARPTNNEHSTGLGLYIVKTLAEILKAEIIVDSEKEQGTTFKIAFNL